MLSRHLRASASRGCPSNNPISQQWRHHHHRRHARAPIAAASAAASTPAPPSPAGADPDPEGRRAHNARQAGAFSGPAVLETFSARQPPEIEARLARIARAATRGLANANANNAVSAAPPPPLRVVDVGAGTGCMVPHLRACGVEDILAVDVSEPMLTELRRAHSSAKTESETGSASATALLLGNTPAARTWCGDFVDLPAYMGPVDAVVFNAVYGNMHDPRRALLRASLLLRPGGRLVISHPLGRAWHEALRARDGDAALVPHALPADRAALAEAARGLPLVVEEDEFVDEGGQNEEGLFCAVLSVPPAYALDARAVPAVAAATSAGSGGGNCGGAGLAAGTPVLRLEAPIVRGFGRGSRQLGVPTANLDPRALAAGGLPLDPHALPRGVYFGWARLMAGEGGGGGDDDDYSVHPMVMNVGVRPTVNVGGQEDASVEVHVMHRYSASAATAGEQGGVSGQQQQQFAEFYGARMRVVVTGFLRPEIRFDGLPALLSRIKADIGVSKAQLLDERGGPHFAARRDAFLSSSP